MPSHLKHADPNSPESKTERDAFAKATQGPYWAYHKKLFVSKAPAQFNRATHRHDNFAKGDRYFISGYSVVKLLEIAMWLGRTHCGKNTNILDFGGGFGRVTRFLRACFSQSNIYHCDFNKEAVAFCAKQFNAKSFPTPQDISEVNESTFPADFDIIWLGSIFTHTTKEHTIRLLEVFANKLRAGGLIVFTTAGDYVAQRLQLGEISGLDVESANKLLEQYHSTGYGYTVYPTRDVEVPWGRTLYSRNALESLYQDISDKFTLLASMPRAMIGRQDVSIIQKRP